MSPKNFFLILSIVFTPLFSQSAIRDRSGNILEFGIDHRTKEHPEEVEMIWSALIHSLAYPKRDYLIPAPNGYAIIEQDSNLKIEPEDEIKWIVSNEPLSNADVAKLDRVANQNTTTEKEPLSQLGNSPKENPKRNLIANGEDMVYLGEKTVAILGKIIRIRSSIDLESGQAKLMARSLNPRKSFHEVLRFRANSPVLLIHDSVHLTYPNRGKNYVLIAPQKGEHRGNIVFVDKSKHQAGKGNRLVIGKAIEADLETTTNSQGPRPPAFSLLPYQGRFYVITRSRDHVTKVYAIHPREPKLEFLWQTTDIDLDAPTTTFNAETGALTYASRFSSTISSVNIKDGEPSERPEPVSNYLKIGIGVFSTAPVEVGSASSLWNISLCEYLLEKHPGL